METLLDEILSPQATGKHHANACGCAACGSKAADKSLLYPHWKERRQQRLKPGDGHAAPCHCDHCRGKQESEFEYGDNDFHTYWRRRRQLRHGWPLGEHSLEILLETPVVQLVSLHHQPVPALPLYREFEPVITEEEAASGLGASTVRIVYVYQENNNVSCRKPGWQKSEKDVLGLYQTKYPTASAQGIYYRGKPLNQSKKGSTRPDVVVPSGAQSFNAMRLPLSAQAELEIIEVKRYQVGNIPSLFSRLVKQINARKSINVPGGEQGKYQSVVLDFRGQEGRCTEIKAAAKRVAERLKTSTKGITILVQVMLWKGPNCASCRGQTQTL